MFRWIVRLLAIVVFVYGVVLVEAHYEMAQTRAALPLQKDLAAVSDGAEGPVRVRYINSGTQVGPDGRRGTYGGFLLEWADGRAFAIDLGMTKPTAIDFAASLELLGAEPVEAFGSFSEVLGDEAKKVAAVGFSHLHYDHTEGIRTICASRASRPGGAELAVYQVPDQYHRGNFGTWAGQQDVDEAGCATRRQLRSGPLYEVLGFPGLAAFGVGGHTPGSTVWVAKVGGKHWIFAGDVTNHFANLKNDVAKPLPYSTLLIPESRTRLHELRVWLSQLDDLDNFTVVVSHDLDRIAEVGIEIVPK